jgi:uncharacterized protein (DUF983 family)
MTDNNGNNNPVLSREFIVIIVAAIIILAAFLLVALQVPIPDWLVMVVTNITAIFLGQRIERLR